MCSMSLIKMTIMNKDADLLYAHSRRQRQSAKIELIQIDIDALV